MNPALARTIEVAAPVMVEVAATVMVEVAAPEEDDREGIRLHPIHFYLRTQSKFTTPEGYRQSIGHG